MRKPGTSGQLSCTPAMQAGLVDTLWTIENLFGAVMKEQADKKRAERYQRLIDACES